MEELLLKFNKKYGHDLDEYEWARTEYILGTHERLEQFVSHEKQNDGLVLKYLETASEDDINRLRSHLKDVQLDGTETLDKDDVKVETNVIGSVSVQDIDIN